MAAFFLWLSSSLLGMVYRLSSVSVTDFLCFVYPVTVASLHWLSCLLPHDLSGDLPTLEVCVCYPNRFSVLQVSVPRSHAGIRHSTCAHENLFLCFLLWVVAPSSTSSFRPETRASALPLPNLSPTTRNASPRLVKFT